MANVNDFLSARIAEDEAVARQVEADLQQMFGHASSALSSDLQGAGSGYMDYPVLTVDPTRVLAECAAKRAILEWDASEYVGYPPVKHLAAVYADHPDYRDEWRP